MATQTLTATPTTHTIPGPPSRVRLSAPVHAELVGRMIAGRTFATTGSGRIVAVLTQDAIAARNTLLTAYTPWVESIARRGATDPHSADDRAAQALLRVTERLAHYNPSTGTPIGAWLIGARIIIGREVAEAGLPLTNSSPADRRRATETGGAIAFPCSLDQPAGDGTSTLGDMIGTPTESDPAVIFDQNQFSPETETALAALSPAQRACLTAHLGLDGSDPQTMTEIAAANGVSVQSVSKTIEIAKARVAAALTAAVSA